MSKYTLYMTNGITARSYPPLMPLPPWMYNLCLLFSSCSQQSRGSPRNTTSPHHRKALPERTKVSQ